MAATDSVGTALPLDAVKSRPFLGITFLLLATTIFPIQDVIVKSLSSEFAVHQIVVWRGLFALPIVILIAWYEGARWPLKIGSFRLQLLRSATAFASYLMYYMALATIGLAETAAITFSTPIFVTVLATIFLGEKIGAFRWLAIGIGLAGILVAVQPGAGVFEPAAVLALLAAISYAVSIIATRKLGSRTNGGTMTLITVVFFIIAGAILALIFSQVDGSPSHPSLAFLYRGWATPTMQDWLMLMALGLISGVGFFALSQAYLLAEASVVTPFEYSYLPWSVFWGIMIFGSYPAWNTWVGIILIVGAGLLIVFRETLRGRRLVRRKGLGVLRQR